MPTLATNNKAYHNYEILESFEAGIALTGAEVKSIKAGKLQLGDCYARITPQGELIVHNMYVAPYPQSQDLEYDPYHPRKLLLHREELHQINQKAAAKNMTIIPLKIYSVRHGLIKVEIGLAKGKKQYEKREVLKERQLKKDIAQTLKKYR